MTEPTAAFDQEPVTVREGLGQAAQRLRAAGCDSPRLDAELLLAWVLQCDRAHLVLDPDLQLEPAQAARFAELVARRAAREPLAYILGTKQFRRITLALDSRALVPRPETELLVEVGLSAPWGASVVDVGTGCGAVALALKDERPDLRVVGIELDSQALELARMNAARLGLDVELIRGDLLEGFPGRPDVVLANLPYVAAGTSELPPELDHEPAHALFAGSDGLEAIRRLVELASAVPVVALEVGFDQAEEVHSLLRRAGFASIERLRDLAGHERVLVGRR